MTNPGGHELAFQLPSLPERVWDALTNPVKVAGWFGENDLAAQAGHRFTIRPRPASGFDGPITGEVLAVDAPNRLVMRWRTSSGDLVMSWLVEPGKGGTRLRVIQTSVLGPGRVHEAAFVGAQEIYRTLFDEQLRGFLRSGMLGRLQPPPRPKGPASLFEPAVHPEPESSPVAAFNAIEPESSPVAAFNAIEPESSPVAAFDAIAPNPERRRDWEPGPHQNPDRPWSRGVVIAICAGVALAVALGGWAVAAHPLKTWGAPGPQGKEISAAIDTTSGTDVTAPGDPGASGGSAGSGRPAAPGDPGGPVAPGPGGSGTQPVTPLPSDPTGTAGTLAAMTVGFEFLSTSLLGYTARVTVANPAGDAQSWQNAKVTLTGVNLSVSDVDTNVTYTIGAGVVCFYPSEAVAAVPPGGAVSFSFYVTAPVVLGTISAAALNDTAC
jgi:uncharacterized protein YndB with AHSA1/START domain